MFASGFDAACTDHGRVLESLRVACAVLVGCWAVQPSEILLHLKTARTFEHGARAGVAWGHPEKAPAPAGHRRARTAPSGEAVNLRPTLSFEAVVFRGEVVGRASRLLLLETAGPDGRCCRANAFAGIGDA